MGMAYTSLQARNKIFKKIPVSLTFVQSFLSQLAQTIYRNLKQFTQCILSNFFKNKAHEYYSRINEKHFFFIKCLCITDKETQISGQNLWSIYKVIDFLFHICLLRNSKINSYKKQVMNFLKTTMNVEYQSCHISCNHLG